MPSCLRNATNCSTLPRRLWGRDLIGGTRQVVISWTDVKSQASFCQNQRKYNLSWSFIQNCTLIWFRIWVMFLVTHYWIWFFDQKQVYYNLNCQNRKLKINKVKLNEYYSSQKYSKHSQVCLWTCCGFCCED